MERGEFREAFALLASYCNVLYKDREIWEKEYWAEFGAGFDIGEFKYLIRQWMNQSQYRKIPTPKTVKKLNGYAFHQSQPQRALKATQQPSVDPEDPSLLKGIEYLKSHGLKVPPAVLKIIKKAKDF